MTTITDARSAVVATATLTYTGQPSENDTVTIGDVIYRFRDSGNVAQAYDVLIDSTADDTWTNFTNAVIAGTGGGTSGTSKYYNGGDYVAHPYVTASINTTSDIVTLTVSTPGSIATSENAANVSLATTSSVTTYLGDVVAVLEVADQAPTMAAQQSSVGYRNPLNTAWVRNMRVSSVAIAMMRYGSSSVGFLNVAFAKICVLLEKVLAWSPPVVTTQPVAMSVVADGSYGDFTVVFGSELTMTYAWKESADGVTYGSALTTTGIYDVSVAGRLRLTPTQCYLVSNNTNVSDAETVTIGTRVYRFKDTMAQIDDIKRGADADATLANFLLAINATGVEGTNYYAGTTVNTQVSASASAADITAHKVRLTGKAAGTVAVSDDSATLTWKNANGDTVANVVSVTGYYYKCTATDNASTPGSKDSAAVILTVT